MLYKCFESTKPFAENISQLNQWHQRAVLQGEQKIRAEMISAPFFFTWMILFPTLSGLQDFFTRIGFFSFGIYAMQEFFSKSFYLAGFFFVLFPEPSPSLLKWCDPNHH